jgi:hypothetical protein
MFGWIAGTAIFAGTTFITGNPIVGIIAGIGAAAFCSIFGGSSSETPPVNPQCQSLVGEQTLLWIVLYATVFLSFSLKMIFGDKNHGSR